MECLPVPSCCKALVVAPLGSEEREGAPAAANDPAEPGVLTQGQAVLGHDDPGRHAPVGAVTQEPRLRLGALAQRPRAAVDLDQERHDGRSERHDGG